MKLPLAWAHETREHALDIGTSIPAAAMCTRWLSRSSRASERDLWGEGQCQPCQRNEEHKRAGSSRGSPSAMERAGLVVAAERRGVDDRPGQTQYRADREGHGNQ